MRIICLIVVCIFFLSCTKSKYRPCEFESADQKLKLYHDILTELVEQHFYNRYLRQVSGDFEKYAPVLDLSDTAAFKKDLMLAQNKLYNDTAKFETICYRTTLEYGPWNFFQTDSSNFFTRARTDTTEYLRDIRTLLSSFSSNWESVAETIAKPQTEYNSDSFQLCTSKVISCQHFYESDIGVVSFSKAFMNDGKTKALLYYEFTCGGKCGMGEIILAEVVNQRWTIKKVGQLWIS